MCGHLVGRVDVLKGSGVEVTGLQLTQKQRYRLTERGWQALWVHWATLWIMELTRAE